MRRVGAYLLFAFVSVPINYAAAGEMPGIKISPNNAVPECVTPGRLLAFLKDRNPGLNANFDRVPIEYMRIGDELGVRWDFAFYQMMLETGSLSYRNGSRAGDVKPTQNNFAGLGATGRGESGESFKDIAAGVRAHLEHLLLYSGERLENPTAERTRKVQEWGVLTNWQARFKRPITFVDLAAQWAPGSGSYARMLDGISERFAAFCDQPDPRPELVAEARGHRGKVAEAKPERPSGAELAKRAIDDAKAEENNQRFALGAQQAAKAPPAPYKILNPAQDADAQAAVAPPTGSLSNALAPAAKAEAPAATKTRESKPRTATTKQQLVVASAAGAAKPLVPPAAAGQKCRVWTASYGGQKALIIKSIVDKVVNYTVLDVNEGAESREADAFIAAYAKEGAIAGEFGSQSQALDKAFELCPEG